MYILTENNTPLSVNDISEDMDIMIGILDYSNPKTADYFFYPLWFMEGYRTPAVELIIGEKDIVTVPMDWSIVIADKDSGEVEIFPIKKIIDRNFDAFIMNPISGFMPEFKSVNVLNIFPDLKWNVPKLSTGHILCVPIKNQHQPDCIFITAPNVKVTDILDITRLI